MADLLVAAKLLAGKRAEASREASREGFEGGGGGGEEARPKQQQGGRAAAVAWAWAALWTLLFGVPAFVLSWTSNARAGWGWPARLAFGALAFLFGFLYLVVHLVNKLDLLLALKALGGGAPALAPAAGQAMAAY